MSFYQKPPVPKTRLGYHRALSPLAGVHVSPIALGTMGVGDQWEEKLGFGKTSKEGSFELLDAFYEAGGNFIDTANFYQDGSSEQFIGEWVELRGIRNQMVISTKYGADFARGKDSILQHSCYVGMHTKSLHVSLEESLKNLRTSYIDILYVHFWDWTTPVQEVMNALHVPVMQGKVLYLGISDAPAWVVSQANEYARACGKTPFVIYQGAWNVLDRSFEREIIPMARTLGIALAPWSVLKGGRLRTDAEEEERQKSGELGRQLWATWDRNNKATWGSWRRNEREKKMSDALEKVAHELGAQSIAAVAIAYVMQKAPYVFPVVGSRKAEHLVANLEALELSLTQEHIAFLESIVPFEPGFPQYFIGDGEDYPPMYRMAGYFDRTSSVPAIKPEPRAA